MPKFLDLFVHEIRKRRNFIKEMLEKGYTSTLDEDFKALFSRNWHPLPDGETEALHLFAVDGSRGVREYANGSRFYVARAFALPNRGRKLRLLETGMFRARGSEEDVRRYIRQKAELMETKLALEAVPHLRGSRKVILIDGSLYGRMMHLPRDSPVEGDRGFLIEYMDVYSKLLSVCKRENVLLVGASKDSQAEFLRDELLNQIYLKELRSLNSALSSKEIKTLETCVEEMDERPDMSFRIFRGLRKKYGPLLDKFEGILTEHIHTRPDFQLILSFASLPGYCTPTELGPIRRTKKEFESMMRDPERYVRRRFRNSIAESMDREDEFVKHAVEVIHKMLRFPTVISFHVLLDARDTPLRIDIPSWICGSENTLSSFMKTQLVEVNDMVEELICMLKSGYAGLRDYNVWLKRADEEVRLRRKDMDALYERVLEKELGLTLIHTRGYRRVKYP